MAFEQVTVSTSSGDLTYYTMPSGIANMSSIQWEPVDIVSTSTNTFTGQQSTFDWQAAYWAGTLSFPTMKRVHWDEWQAFLSALRGPLNPFLFGDPKAATPKGSPLGTPVVHGSGQGVYGSGTSCFQVTTSGWSTSATGLLLAGDYIQIGLRLYRVTSDVDADHFGLATIPIWPNLRDQPTDGTGIITSNCKGLFRLSSGQGNSSSTNVKGYGITGLKIREYL